MYPAQRDTITDIKFSKKHFIFKYFVLYYVYSTYFPCIQAAVDEKPDYIKNSSIFLTNNI
ncbi:hypothetical protein AMJ80_07175 [bacterium SM23_31]|nr:MAG: hypothetical protein AMJ80_07175 [bacterium SM23_31]